MVHEKNKEVIKMDKTDVGKMISNTVSLRDKLLIGLLASGLRSYDLRKLKPNSIRDNQIIIRKNPRENMKTYCVSKEIANHLNNYIKKEQIGENEYIFPIPNYLIDKIVKKVGHSIGKDLNAHSLRKLVIMTSLNFMPKEYLDKMISRRSSLDKKSYER